MERADRGAAAPFEHALLVVDVQEKLAAAMPPDALAELVKRGYAAHVVADAVTSRRDENRRIGLSLCERAGAFVSATETVAFDLLEQAGTAELKAISKLRR